MRIKLRWYHAYLLLAALDLATVSGSLYLTGRLARQSAEFFRVRQEWAEIHDDFTLLGRLASEVNAPGNDIFESENANRESSRLRAATAEFSGHAANLGARLSRQHDHVAVARLLDELDDAIANAQRMADTCQAVLDAFDAGSREEAARMMAVMDRQLLGLIGQTSSMGARVTAVKVELYARHQAAIDALHRLERVIAALLMVMVLGAAWYGLRSLHEQRRTAAALAQANSDLEVRVAERTAEVHAGLEARDRLLKGLFSAQEAERRRIASELHDGIGQQLVTLLMRMQAQAKTLTDEHCRLALEDMRRIVGETVQEVRGLSHGLRPSVLDDIGLVPALERLVADVRQTGLLQVELSIEHAPQQRLPEDIETAVYRIAQEAVSNALKHSGASRVQVGLTCGDQEVSLIVSDDGRGLPSAADASEGLGLPGMRERAILLHGELQIASAPGQGTTVRVTIPLLRTSV